MEELERQFSAWRCAFEGKGLKVNMKKTKIMVCTASNEVRVRAKIDPCGICHRRVMRNSVLCTKCRSWIHGRCAGVRRVTSRLATDYVCSKCVHNGECDGDNIEHVGAVSERLPELERVEDFCYLGDSLDGAGGSELAVTRRVGLGWKKFRDLESVLCGRRLTLAMKGRIYKACVRPVMTYASETWVVRAVEEGILMRAERGMLRRICGVKLSDRVRSEVLMKRLGLMETIVMAVRRNCLRWYGHVLRKDEAEGVKRAWNLEVDGRRGRGRPKLTWKSIVDWTL